jgi:hypothetical protein
MRPADTLRNGQDWLASVVAPSCSLTVQNVGNDQTALTASDRLMMDN